MTQPSKLDTRIPIKSGDKYFSTGGKPFIVGTRDFKKDGDWFCIFDDIVLSRRAKYIKTNKVYHPNDKNVQGVGYLGIGKYNTKNSREGYSKWSGMMKRCYAIKEGKPLYPSYVDNFVCDEWHNFQNFMFWYTENYKCSSDLDKDFKGIALGRKDYSPETCTLIPKGLNLALSRKPLHPPKEYGVYKAFIRVGGKRIVLGRYTLKVNAMYMNCMAKLGYIGQLLRQYGLEDELKDYIEDFNINYMEEVYEQSLGNKRR